MRFCRVGSVSAIGGNYEETDKTIKHFAIKEETNIDLNLDQLCFLEREIKSGEFDLTTFYCLAEDNQKPPFGGFLLDKITYIDASLIFSFSVIKSKSKVKK